MSVEGRGSHQRFLYICLGHMCLYLHLLIGARHSALTLQYSHLLSMKLPILDKTVPGSPAKLKPSGPSTPISPIRPRGPCRGRQVVSCYPLATGQKCGTNAAVPASPDGPGSPDCPFSPLGPSGPVNPLKPGGPGSPLRPGQFNIMSNTQVNKNLTVDHHDWVYLYLRPPLSVLGLQGFWVYKEVFRLWRVQ